MTNYEKVINDLRWLASARNNMPEYKKRMCQSAADALDNLLEERSAQHAAEKNEAQTNADAIRAMSDEELAEHLNDWQDWGGGLSTEMWIEWLRQPKEAKC